MKNKVIVVIGMHRSGSSVLSKALSCIGVKMGSVFIEADEFNPRGYWEDEEVVRFNNRILSSLGCEWDSLGLFFHSTELLAACELYRPEAIKLIERKKETNTLWGFKDPRASRLLPFWNDVFRELKITPLYVISSRSPYCVYQSLKKRNDFSKEKSTLLWLEHMLASIRDTENCNRLIVDNKKLMKSPELELKRLADFIGANDLSESVLSKFANDFLDPSLNHYDEDTVSKHVTALDIVSSNVYASLSQCDYIGALKAIELMPGSLKAKEGIELIKEHLLFEIVKERNEQALMYSKIEKSIEEKDLYVDSLIEEVRKSREYAGQLEANINDIKEYPDTLLLSLNISKDYTLSLVSELKSLKNRLGSISHSLLQKEAYAESLEASINKKDEYTGLLIEQGTQSIEQLSLVRSDLNSSKEYVSDLERVLQEKDKFIRHLISDNDVITNYIENLKLNKTTNS